MLRSVSFLVMSAAVHPFHCVYGSESLLCFLKPSCLFPIISEIYNCREGWEMTEMLLKPILSQHRLKKKSVSSLEFQEFGCCLCKLECLCACSICNTRDLSIQVLSLQVGVSMLFAMVAFLFRYCSCSKYCYFQCARSVGARPCEFLLRQDPTM